MIRHAWERYASLSIWFFDAGFDYDTGWTRTFITSGVVRINSVVTAASPTIFFRPHHSTTRWRILLHMRTQSNSTISLPSILRCHLSWIPNYQDLKSMQFQKFDFTFVEKHGERGGYNQKLGVQWRVQWQTRSRDTSALLIFLLQISSYSSKDCQLDLCSLRQKNYGTALL